MLKYTTLQIPPDTPVTTPLLETVAIEVFKLTHGLDVAAVPEPNNCVVSPTQRLSMPDMVGLGLTLKTTVLAQDPELV